MSDDLTISISAENLDSGPAEERATFGLLSVTANDNLLTEGVETDTHIVRNGPYVSGCPLAEWLLWNWWRIRWEVRRPAKGDALRRWHFAHSMYTVGDGYVWPNVTIISDNLSVFLSSRPSSDSSAVLFRYLGANRREEVPVTSLESGVDEFLMDVLSRLENCGLRETNVNRLWHDLQTEREDPELSRYRRLEAQLGFDPDEADEAMLRSRLNDASSLGDEALGELASDTMLNGDPLYSMMSARDISDIADRKGFDADLDSSICITESIDVPRPGQVEPWRLGRDVARRVRGQERLDGLAITNARLAELAGTVPEIVCNTHRCSPNNSFMLRNDNEDARVSLRSWWQTGRRFELSRLIGDRLVNDQSDQPSENLFPAILHSNSYRQKDATRLRCRIIEPNCGRG